MMSERGTKKHRPFRTSAQVTGTRGATRASGRSPQQAVTEMRGALRLGPRDPR